MNPFVNPRKRSISLPAGCKDLGDVLGRLQLAAKSPVRRFINLLLMQAEQDCATELVIGVAPEGSDGIPIKYKVEGCWYDTSPFPSDIRARVVRELGKMAGLRKGRFPQDGVLSVRLPETTLTWRIRIASPNAECVLTKTDV
jgi:type II secretory ATPase GspE/PulE/Tfp pilus assembly ATPase PilB-like protein